MDFNEEQEILAAAMQRFAVEDKKLYAALEGAIEEKDEEGNQVLINGIKDSEVDIFALLPEFKNLYTLQCITNCLMQRIMKRQQQFGPGKMIIPPGGPLPPDPFNINKT